LLTGIVLLLNAMEVSPTLHKLFHSDANTTRHECAVTLFAHGQVDSTSADVPVVAALASVQTLPAVEISLFSPAIENLPAERAPPVACPNA
jgi:hypothetical protein